MTSTANVLSERIILENLRQNLNSDNNFSSDFYYENNCVSVYDVKELLWATKFLKDEFEKTYTKNMDALVKEKYGNNAYCFISGFDYNKENLGICFKYSWDSKLISLDFSKEGQRIKVDGMLDNRRFLPNVIVPLLENEISSLYDRYVKLKSYNNDFRTGVQSPNSNFAIDIDKSGVELYYKGDVNSSSDNNKFSIKYRNEQDDYKIRIGSKEVVQDTEETNEEIFKNIFIKIKDCPEWMHQYLYGTKVRMLEELEELNSKKETLSDELNSKSKTKRFISYFKRK